MLIAGSPAIQGALLVVNAVDGVMHETESQVRLAGQTAVSAIVTFLNTADKMRDAELIEICEMEIRELLTDCGYTPENAPLIVGNAQNALRYRGKNLNSEQWKPIVDLIFAMNRCMPQPQDASDLPLLMPVRQVIDEPGDVAKLYGQVVQGRLAVGTPVDVVGKGDRIRTRCIGLKQSEGTDQAYEVQVDAEPGWMAPGQVVTAPKKFRSYTNFEAAIYVMTPDECGNHSPLVGNDKPEINLWTIDVTGQLRLPPDVAIVNPGAHATVGVSLDVPMVLQPGVRFGVKKMGVEIGIGVVTEILAMEP